MKIYTLKLFTTEVVKSNPSYLFIFGDNDIKVGKGGQAIIRHESNTAGIPTKKLPNNKESSFYNDDEYDSNVEKIDIAIKIIKQRIFNSNPKYEAIVFPVDGLGTGLANLPIVAPLTFKYLVEQIEILKEDMKNI